MQEVIDTANTFRSSPDLFPWVVLVIMMLFMYKERHIIKDLFMSIIDSYKEEKLYRTGNIELARRVTTALEETVAALEEAKKDREHVVKSLEANEKMNAERMVHIQEVINRIDKTVNENSKKISIITDRTDRG